MNRRELLQSVIGVAAASGVEVKASSYDGPPEKPALVVLECDYALSDETSRRLMSSWEDGVKGTPFEGVKAIVFADGLRLTVLDANGHVLNRAIEPAEQ
jgi:hypothetical protein